MKASSHIISTHVVARIRHGIAQRLPFFYGWLMIPMAMLGMIATSPGQTYGIAVFNPYLREALELSHSQLTGMYMLGSFVACFPMSYVGMMMDRHGIRRTMLVVVVAFGGTCILVSKITGMVSLFLAFLFLRMLGQGALTLLASNTLSMWFNRHLGTVSGLKSVGTALAIAIIPNLFAYLIQEHGWRTSYVFIGLTLWIVMLPLIALLFHDRPEDIGQLRDGSKPNPDDDNQTDDADDEINLDLSQAIRTRAFWIMAASTAFWGMFGTAITFNIVPLFESHGLTDANATQTFVTLAIGMGTMQFIGGMLADRIPLNRLLSVSMFLMAGSAVVLFSLTAPWIGHVYALLFGSGQALIGVVGNTIWARYYGRSHLGKIRGSIWMAAVAGSSVGPFIMGFTFDQFGGYGVSIAFFCTVLSVLGVAAVFATRPGQA